MAKTIRSLKIVKAEIKKAEKQVWSLRKELQAARAAARKICSHSAGTDIQEGSKWDPDLKFCRTCNLVLFKRDANKRAGAWIPISKWKDSRDLKYWRPGDAPSLTVYNEDEDGE